VPPETERADSEPTLDQREVEWQFDAVDLRPVRRWLEARPDGIPPALRPWRVEDLVDTYWDTDDWRLHRAGWSLRTRASGGAFEASLKSFAPAHDGRRDRREITEPLSGTGADTVREARGGVGERVRVLAGPRPLRPLFEVRTRRTVVSVIVGGRAAAELALDDTTIPLAAGERPARIQRVEVEVGSDVPDEVRAFVDELRSACGLQPAASSKFETGLLATGLTPLPPPDLGPTEVDDAKSVGEVAFAVLRTHFIGLLEHEPGARLGEDPEEVHDMRVAIRRMRAAMTAFKDALPVRSEALRRELKWLATALGKVRDLDVQLEQVREWALELPAEDREALEPVLQMLGRRRSQARQQLLRVLDSRRYERLTASLTSMLQRGPLRRSAPSRTPALLAGPDLVTRRYRRMRKAGDPIDTESSPEALHGLRIRGKRLRYAAEFLQPVYGKPASGLIKRLTAMQDVLGLYQDAQVATEQVRRLAEEHGSDLPAQAVFALGRLAERYRLQAVEQRAMLPGVYRRIRGKSWKRLRRTMERRRAGLEATLSTRPARPRPPAPSRVVSFVNGLPA
jgi:CHAD domain-containing protein